MMTVHCHTVLYLALYHTVLYRLFIIRFIHTLSHWVKNCKC